MARNVPDDSRTSLYCPTRRFLDSILLLSIMHRGWQSLRIASWLAVANECHASCADSIFASADERLQRCVPCSIHLGQPQTVR